MHLGGYLSQKEVFQIFKQIYSYPNERIIYLMVSFAFCLLKSEVAQLQNIEEVDFDEKHLLFGKVFNHVFKNQVENN